MIDADRLLGVTRLALIRKRSWLHLADDLTGMKGAAERDRTRLSLKAH